MKHKSSFLTCMHLSIKLSMIFEGRNLHARPLITRQLKHKNLNLIKCFKYIEGGKAEKYSK